MKDRNYPWYIRVKDRNYPCYFYGLIRADDPYPFAELFQTKKDKYNPYADNVFERVNTFLMGKNILKLISFLLCVWGVRGVYYSIFVKIFLD